MAPRCRYPSLVVGACRVYRLALWLYPPALRREFQGELLIAFRNRAEDVINTGSVAAVLFFAVHLGADWLRTFTFEIDEPPAFSMLGLSGADDHAFGCMDRSTFSVSLLLATLGVVLLIAGWYGWLSLNAEIMRHHRPI